MNDDLTFFLKHTRVHKRVHLRPPPLPPSNSHILARTYARTHARTHIHIHPYINTPGPNAADADEANACTAVEFSNDGGYVCVEGTSPGARDKTYRNEACAKCNGAAASSITSGPCKSDSPLFHPCINTECGANAHCTVKVADCAFENDHMCGWVPENEGEWINTQERGNGKSPAKLANDPYFPDTYLEGSYKDAWTITMSSPEVELGSQCQLTFWAAFGTRDGTALKVTTGDADVVMDMSPMPENADTWKRYTAGLEAFNGQSVALSFAATLQGSEDYIALDAITVTCQDDPEKPSWAGSCACDPGYAYGVNIPDQSKGTAYGCDAANVDPTRETAQCMPTMETVLKENMVRFSTFYQIVAQQGTSFFTQLSQTVGPRHTLLVPTDDAFAAWDAQDLKNLLPAGQQDMDGSVDHDTLIKEFFEMHMMQKEYLPSCLGDADGSLTEMITEGGDALLLTATSPQYEFNNKIRIVEHIPCGNGQIFVVDTAGKRNHWSTEVSLEKFCTHCDANAICDAPRATSGCPGGCFARMDDDMRSCFTTSGGDCKSATDKEPDVCAKSTAGIVKSYKSECLATCVGAEIVDADGPCPVPQCACKAGFKDMAKGGKPGLLCKVEKVVTTRTRAPTTTLRPDGHLMPQIEFYMNGSYSFVIGGRSAMRDSHFQQVVREGFVGPAAVSSAESMVRTPFGFSCIYVCLSVCLPACLSVSLSLCVCV